MVAVVKGGKTNLISFGGCEGRIYRVGGKKKQRLKNLQKVVP